MSRVSTSLSRILIFLIIVSAALLSPSAQTAAHAQGTLTVYLSRPGVQSTEVAGAATETFDALAAGKYTFPYASTAGIGTYTGSSTNPFEIVAHDEFGGATDSSTSSTLTNYFAVGTESGSTSPVYLTLTKPTSYFGFLVVGGRSVQQGRLVLRQHAIRNIQHGGPAGVSKKRLRHDHSPRRRHLQYQRLLRQSKSRLREQ